MFTSSADNIFRNRSNMYKFEYIYVKIVNCTGSNLILNCLLNTMPDLLTLRLYFPFRLSILQADNYSTVLIFIALKDNFVNYVNID